MSSFKEKASQIKAKFQQEILKDNVGHSSSQQQLKITRERIPPNSQNQKIYIQEPIIIEKRTVISTKLESSRKQKNPQVQKTTSKKEVQPFVPVVIPTRDRKVTAQIIGQNLATNKCNKGNKQIEIQIEKDDKSKQCLKKLFKKIHKLTEDLKDSESERIRLKLELENYKNIETKTNNYEAKLNALACDKYKLEVELDLLKRLIKERDSQIQRHRSVIPKEIIKQVIIEKPVEVIIQVPKPIPGPQVIVQKIIEVPKYVEIEKKVPYEIPRQVIKTIEVPTVTEKIVYVDKPIYIDREVPVHIDRQIPIQVPIEKPIYIDRPYVQEQLLQRLRKYELEIDHLMRINSELDDENKGLRITIDQLSYNLSILTRHNQEKNREVQHLLHNSVDYNPYSPSQDYSLGSVKYTISSKNHKRAI